jgi:hypothetical protein
MSKDLITTVPNGSLVKAIGDMMDGLIEVHDAVKAERLRTRLGQLGQAEMGSRVAAARKAEVIYDIQGEEDWKQLLNPDTGEAFQTWSEFREKLKDTFAIGLGTIGDYLSIVRMARQVFGVEGGNLPMVGGLSPVRAVSGLFAGTDARANEDITRTLRPATMQVRDMLVKDFGPPRERDDDLSPWLDHARRLFERDYAHDLVDPTAINKPPAELHEQAREYAGRPRVTYHRNGDGNDVKWILQYPHHTDESGNVVETGEADSGIMKLDAFVPSPVREDLARKLRLG